MFELLNQTSPVSPGIHHDLWGRFIPLKVFDSLKEVDDLKKNKLKLFWELISLLLVTRALEEAMRNAVQHAGECHLRLVVAQRYLGPPARIQLAIVDSGIGIRASLFNKSKFAVGSAKRAALVKYSSGNIWESEGGRAGTGSD